ncbi:hypothetical protein LDHU3_31.3680:CDS1 [Leishmania donovani]|uniref:Hypothetical_protein n=2 Tax=Leishmania donovani species complex TaxID=38574 RepID=A0A6L0XW11_LEIIN|nr:hypothetical_protein [Leishmania infantum]CAJ1991399.1 hypothetical protein LDHU3_31.3680:CDS1 [Leishmania donovani]SUZ44428.1 hypothetical_protein [Leishmania infantum]VDZ47243.1 hypothetical_protein [Leishmania donovani]
MRQKCLDATAELLKTVFIESLNASKEAALTTGVRCLCKVEIVWKKSDSIESGLFQECLEIPLVIVTPGSIQVGHTASEHVHVAVMEHCWILSRQRLRVGG